MTSDLPESDRGESRSGYQTSGPPEGGPFCLAEARVVAGSSIGVSDKSLRGYTISSSSAWSPGISASPAYGHRVNCPGEKRVSTSQILTEARLLFNGSPNRHRSCPRKRGKSSANHRAHREVGPIACQRLARSGSAQAGYRTIRRGVAGSGVRAAGLFGRRPARSTRIRSAGTRAIDSQQCCVVWRSIGIFRTTGRGVRLHGTGN